MERGKYKKENMGERGLRLKHNANRQRGREKEKVNTSAR